MTFEEIKNNNNLIFDRLSLLLNNQPDFITSEMVSDLTKGFGISVKDAFSMLLCAAMGLDTENETDKEIWDAYSPYMVHQLDASVFESDPYYQRVRIANGKKAGEWELREERLKPFSAFVCNDPLTLPDGRIIPQIGFFEREFKFLSVLQNGREWMTMMPNELVTQREPINRARGKVCTYGLGLGYFAFMCAEKQEVERVTVVEMDESVISLFKELLLPNFPHKEKIEIICADAFDFAAKEAPKRNFDYIFADIWHDPSDGVEAYLQFKLYEHLCPETKFDYWIEKTLKLYI